MQSRPASGAAGEEQGRAGDVETRELRGMRDAKTSSSEASYDIRVQQDIPNSAEPECECAVELSTGVPNSLSSSPT